VNRRRLHRKSTGPELTGTNGFSREKNNAGYQDSAGTAALSVQPGNCGQGAGNSASHLIECRALSLGYDRQPVVHQLDFHVDAGEVVAILGPNGAGKTTTLLGLSGEIGALSGELIVDGEAVGDPLYKRARGGLSYVTEERSVFSSLSTIDNFRAGRVPPEAGFELFPALRPRARVRGGLLSGGEQQMLTLARAILRRPRVLLADELSLGLAPMVVRLLLDKVREAADTGCGVVLVEQHVRRALEVADRCYVMQRGRVELTGTAAEMLDRIDEIEAKYLT
jgi:branched-chain amino acid transport system ATP-binding protein